MKRTECLIALEPLLKKPYFTAKEVRALGIKTALIHYYIKLGVLKRIQRGMYQNSTNKNPTFKWRDLIEAVTSISGGVVCLVSALAIYEITDEIPRMHWIAVTNTTSAKKQKQLKIIRMRNMKLGLSKIDLEGVLVPIFDKERTIVDSFRLLSREVAIKSLKMALLQKGTKKINLIKLQKYAKLLRVNINDFLMTATT